MLTVHDCTNGHGGRSSPEGEGMGEFTIYDWGNGAASEAYIRVLDKLGKELWGKDFAGG